MADKILKGISILFHPIIFPVMGVFLYFKITPRILDQNTIQVKMIQLVLLTCLLPMLLFFLLKTLGKVNSIYLKSTKERILPLILNGSITILILNQVLTPLDYLELYFFFMGILISTIICLTLAFVKFKSSIHMISIGGLQMFLIALSIHYNVNINELIAFSFLLSGAIATSRLHLKAHTYKELIAGFLIGITPQFILIPNWL